MLQNVYLDTQIGVDTAMNGQKGIGCRQTTDRGTSNRKGYFDHPELSSDSAQLVAHHSSETHDSNEPREALARCEAWQDEGLHEFPLLERLLGMLNRHVAGFSLGVRPDSCFFFNV